ncbi:helix-turn-helix domain-containing protein [Streptomyces sp. NRRL S-146]|uniref:helix-turn-helix domain-containing protein n=1 Tax=Streptomyces sp. NRRL S-146 TaxID=1463884 RepID=UPI0004C5F1F4|nr:helix-turn-helix domain-containing protein [Streptomyces sp. NRRL S-146]
MGVAHLLRPDGSVTVPAAVAGDVLRTLVIGLTARVRADGGAVAPGVSTLLHALQTAAVRADESRHGFVDESPATVPATVEMTAHQAAQVLGCSDQYARSLARSGRVRARRAGPVWLIDRASLDAYRTGRSP